MGTYADFQKLVSGCGLEDDCPVCAYSWPGCGGMCVAHTSMNGQPGPFHQDYNDDCTECTDMLKFKKFEIVHPYFPPIVVTAPNEGAAVEFCMAIHGVLSFNEPPSVKRTTKEANETEASFRRIMGDSATWAGLYEHHTWKEKPK